MQKAELEILIAFRLEEEEVIVVRGVDDLIVFEGLETQGFVEDVDVAQGEVHHLALFGVDGHHLASVELRQEDVSDKPFEPPRVPDVFLRQPGVLAAVTAEHEVALIDGDEALVDLRDQERRRLHAPRVKGVQQGHVRVLDGHVHGAPPQRRRPLPAVVVEQIPGFDIAGAYLLGHLIGIDFREMEFCHDYPRYL